MPVSDDQKRRVEALASSLLAGANDVGDGDATEALASLYAAAQVMERELLGRRHLEPRELLHIQLVGRRIGAVMTVNVDEEVLDAAPETDDPIH